MKTLKILSTHAVALSGPCKKYYEMAREGHFWIEWRLQIFLQQLRALDLLNKPFLKGLDVGCGNGIVRRQIERSTNWSVDGADVVEEVLSFNTSERGDTFLYNVLDRHAALQEMYDFIMLFDVLEHIEETTPFLEAVLYHLKPHGWLFMNVPALPMVFSSYDLAQKHFRRYTKNTLQQALPSDQLKIRDMRYWGCSLLPFAIMRKLLPAKKSSPQAVLERGFQPPTRWMNTWLMNIMRAEMILTPKPLLGTSLMTAAVKLHAPQKRTRI